ncbi:uncharacterized protein LOC126993117 [Eriocheir sinensis]|uniref:uncharacterized protein LOC126993117 n=1 Tax=Eriocheir sinensis TaxID=95602 RepID=UPI0021C770A6|nr:uncharacterized protein LOC126993117 [Eriocheir sinensis]
MISVMNVRGQGQDVRWNDKYRCVLRPRAGGDEGGEGGVEDQAGRFDEQSEANIKFLQEIGEICKVWAGKEKKKRGTKIGRLPTPTASALHITCNALPASCRDIILRKIPGVEYVCMGKANSDPTEHSFGKRRTMCGANYWTSVQNFMVSNRLAQRLHLLKLVGFFPGDVQADLDRAKAEEKEDDELILAQLARELADDQPDPPTDELLLAAVGNYAGYLARKVQANSSVAECCKQELAQQEEMKITVELERATRPL